MVAYQDSAMPVFKNAFSMLLYFFTHSVRNKKLEKMKNKNAFQIESKDFFLLGNFEMSIILETSNKYRLLTVIK